MQLLPPSVLLPISRPHQRLRLRRQPHSLPTAALLPALAAWEQQQFQDSQAARRHDIDRDILGMRAALQQARQAAILGEVPVGAVLVDASGIVLAANHNQTAQRNSPLAHAELLCLEEAAQRLGGWRLLNTTLFVTCEPCPMCAGAVYQARVKRLVYGARQPRVGADGSWIAMFPGSTRTTSAAASTGSGAAGGDSPTFSPILPNAPHPYHPNIQVTRGVLQAECATLLRAFFKARRMAVGRGPLPDPEGELLTGVADAPG